MRGRLTCTRGTLRQKKEKHTTVNHTVMHNMIFKSVYHACNFVVIQITPVRGCAKWFSVVYRIFSLGSLKFLRKQNASEAIQGDIPRLSCTFCFK